MKQKKGGTENSIEIFEKCPPTQYSDTSVYCFSKKGVGPFSSTILKGNLLKLIEDAWKATPPISSSPGDPILVGKQVQHRFSENKENVLYTGKVVSQVPGFQD